MDCGANSKVINVISVTETDPAEIYNLIILTQTGLASLNREHRPKRIVSRHSPVIKIHFPFLFCFLRTFSN